MDIVTLLGVISSITGIISFVLYFLDKKNPSQNNPVGFQDWKIWLVVTMLLVITLILLPRQNITGINGNNNDNNQIEIDSHRNEK